jgi:hypothetical protein
LARATYGGEHRPWQSSRHSRRSTSAASVAWQIYDEQIGEISKLTALTYVRLECWFSAEVDMRLWALASRLPGLTHLHLSGGDFLVSNVGLRAITSLTALSHLHLDGLEHVSNDGLPAITSLASLTHLHLVYCPQVTDEPRAAARTGLARAIL